MVEGVNSTQVELVWNFTASASFGISIEREGPDGRTQIAWRGVGAAELTIVDGFKADYEGHLPATLVIKNVTRNDKYKYTFRVINAVTFVPELFDEVTLHVLCKYNVLVCSLDCRPSAVLALHGIYYYY